VNQMPFDEPNNDVRPGHEAPDELTAAVQHQVSELARRRDDPAVRHELLKALQRRREPSNGEKAASRPGQSPDTYRHDLAKFDFLPAETGFDTLHVQGELLITGRSYDGRGVAAAGRGQDKYAKPYLDELGLEASDVECEELHGRVLRLTSDRGIETQRLADVARNLRMRGFAASLTNIAPTAGILKPPPIPSGPVAQAASAVQPAPAAAERAPGGSAPRSGRGMPVKVAIIDTGITAEDRTDGWLKTVPRLLADIDPLTAFPFPASDPYLDLDAGHGTFVAGLVQRVAPDAEITVYRAIDSDGIASEVAVACEMIRAVKEGAQIVNLSLGCQTPDDTPPIAIAAALEVIGELERETGHQVLVIAAAGNYGDTRPCWPAAFRGVVSVAALAPDMMPAQFSSRGFWVTCSTIGQGLRSTFVEGQLSPLVSHQATVFGPDSWAVWSGTSFTAPQIAGELARLCQEEGLKPREALPRLLAQGEPLPDFGQALRILPSG
jgi:hypothetical protein